MAKSFESAKKTPRTVLKSCAALQKRLNGYTLESLRFTFDFLSAFAHKEQNTERKRFLFRFKH